MKSRDLILAGFAAIALTSCRSTGVAFNPPGGGVRSLRHMYLSTRLGSLQIYKTPVTSASTPVGTITGLAGSDTELFVDRDGRLFVPLDGGAGTTINVYDSPVTSTSTPAFVLTTIDGAIEDTVEDSAGNVYESSDASSTCCIDVFNAPVSGAATANFSINSNGVTPNGLGDPYGMAFDSSGNLYVSSASSILKYTPPITPASTPTAIVTPNQNNYGLLVDSSNRVYVANATVDGTIDVFAQPFTSASTRAFGIEVVPYNAAGGDDVLGMAFDSSGSLWAVVSNGTVWEVKAPISGASIPKQVLSGITDAYGIAFGP